MMAITRVGKNVEYGVVWGGYGSLKVIGNSTIRYSANEFLLAFHSVPIFHRF